jgi:hypothetical protein
MTLSALRQASSALIASPSLAVPTRSRRPAALEVQRAMRGFERRVVRLRLGGVLR